jgi:hypothetical protein
VGEHRTGDNFGGDADRVTIREAATLLGVHPNTIKNRLRKGMYIGEKVLTEHGETWMIDRDSLSTNTPSTAAQTSVGRVPEEALTILAREIVREAGLQGRSSPQEAPHEDWIEGEKLEHETAKTQALITAAILGAAGAARFLPDPHHLYLLSWAATFGIASLALTLTLMSFIANEVKSSRLLFGRLPRLLTDLVSSLCFVATIALLMRFIGVNV